jgi:hypothetical protein
MGGVKMCKERTNDSHLIIISCAVGAKGMYKVWYVYIFKGEGKKGEGGKCAKKKGQ